MQIKKKYIVPKSEFFIIEKEFMNTQSTPEIPKGDGEITNPNDFEILSRENDRTNVWDEPW
jgi:hypothetical protein